MNAIPFARPSIGPAEIDAVSRVLRSGWLTTGEQALAFEREFAAAVGSRHALAVNSATAGLHLALEAVGVGPGDSVIVPSMTFTATAEVVRYLGAEVVFADVSPGTLLIDPTDVRTRAAATVAGGGRVAAIVPVHLAGETCDIPGLRAVAEEFGAALIEDAAHAFPGSAHGAALGTHGDAGVFSFYANKTITTGEGGMVVTDRDDIADRIRTMRSHGIDREAWHRYTAAGTTTSITETPHWYYEVVAPGYKYNLPDTAAALGRVQLRRATELREARYRCARRYLDGLSDLAADGIVALPGDLPGHAWHLFVLRVLPAGGRAPGGGAVDRDALIAALRGRGIGTSVHYIPLHHMPYWRDRYPEAVGRLPETDRAFREIVSLPLYPDLSESDQAHVIAALRELLGAHRGE